MTDQITAVFEQALDDLAVHLAAKAREEKTDIQDAVRVFKELREYYAILTKDGEKGDKSPKDGRRPTATVAEMRKRIAAVSGPREDTEDEPV